MTTVRDLIEELEKLNPDIEVAVACEHTGGDAAHPVVRIEAAAGKYVPEGGGRPRRPALIHPGTRYYDRI